MDVFNLDWSSNSAAVAEQDQTYPDRKMESYVVHERILDEVSALAISIDDSIEGHQGHLFESSLGLDEFNKLDHIGKHNQAAKRSPDYFALYNVRGASLTSQATSADITHQAELIPH